ncbi:Maleylacetate reductase [Baekduia alba]|uniref:maleylacetate reductase n=1 Tax=Baekduia alba TaxID=2997333 RepID=UPI0023407143|nr:maleylacetate reductase [Baekduia alba]WCB91772.1 Maleylacetate reductase [Baekduia alba]
MAASGPDGARVEYEALRGRVLFGCGARAAVPEEVERLGVRRVVLIDGLLDGAPARELEDALGARRVATIGDVRQHVPAALVAQARETATATGADGLATIGGGSAVGLAKAIARATGLPILAVPTTYAGSEMTPIWGITSDGAKTTGRDLAVLPKTVVYDPELTVSLPVPVTAASGMNAVAHCVGAMWTASANPVTDAVAAEGISSLAAGLRGCVRDPGDLGARTEALRGAWLGGAALAVGGTALHHKICHVLGGAFDLPHAEVHAVVLPWVVAHARERGVADAALRRVARALGAEDAVEGLRALTRDLGLAASLADLGLDEAGADRAAELVAEAAPSAPVPVTREQARAILAHALRGE